MLKNYLKIALRSLWRNRLYSLLNTAGLALGIAACILIGLLVQHEISYDRFYPGANRLYRVVQEVSWGDGSTWTGTGPVLGPMLQKDFPEVEAMVRLFRTTRLVSRDSLDLRIPQEGFLYADPAFFDVFGFELVHGDPATALTEPRSIVLTQSVALAYFGDTNPIGHLLRIENDYDIRVTGVLADPPANTHLDVRLVASFATLNQEYDQPTFTSWWAPTVQTYVRLADGSDSSRFDRDRLAAFVKRYREPQYAAAIIPRLQAVTRIHLYGNPGPAAIGLVSIVALIGGFVLLIACVNYMNLSTARAAGRAREVGVRKAIGASRAQLIRQFFGEALVTTLLAMALAVVLTELLLPAFNQIADRRLTMAWGHGWLWLGLTGIAVVVALVSGSYPALALSRFSPAQVLKHAATPDAGGARLRRGLVVLQFGVSIALIISTLVVFSQLQYLRTKSLGFDTEQAAALLTRGDRSVQQGFEAFKSALEQDPGITAVAASNWFPGLGGFQQWGFSLDGIPEGVVANSPLIIYGSPDFIETMGLTVRLGRGFSSDLPADVHSAFLLNETALAEYEVSDPVGRALRVYGDSQGGLVYEKKGEVIGVVADFHVRTLRDPIVPITITLAEKSDYYDYILIRFAPGNLRDPLAFVQRTWTARFPERPFELFFVDDQIRDAYRQEAGFGRVIGAFTVFAILIACLGLFGLAAFTAEQRTKEIGIRKVLGASVPGIVVLLTREFALLIGLGLLVATPFAWMGMNQWLTNFAYRVAIDPMVFVWAGLLALAVGLLTVGFQALRAALANPVRSLRYE